MSLAAATGFSSFFTSGAAPCGSGGPRRPQSRDMVRDYIEGPGRPTLMDGFARSEDTFSFANAKRGRFQGCSRAERLIKSSRGARPR